MENPDQDKNHSEAEKPSDVTSIIESYSPYPLISPVAAAFLGLFGGFFLFHVVGSGLVALFIGLDLNSVPADQFRLISIAGEIIFIFLPAIVLGKWIYGNNSKIISLKIPHWKELLLFILGIVILTPLLQSYLYIQNYLIERLAEYSQFFNTIKTGLDFFNELIEKTYLNLMSANSFPEMLFVIITVSIIPALCEEVLFRGYIQRSFEMKIKPFYAALITAVFFALFHLIPTNIIPLTIIGFYLGFAAYSSQSLVIPMILHFLNNFFAVMFFFIFGDEEIIQSDVTDMTSLNTNLIYFFLFLLMFTVVIFLIKNYYKKRINVSEV